MNTEENKKRWKKEAQKLKQDLDNRKKVIKKREVEIKFPKKPLLKDQVALSHKNKESDDFLRNQINFK